MKNLIKTLQKYIPTSSSLIDEIGTKSRKIVLKARVEILSPKKDQNSLLFLTKGITRNFYKSGSKEWTSHFSQAGEFVVSVENFLLNLPCNEFIETCTSVELIEITKTDYQKLISDNPELYIVGFYIANEQVKLGINRMFDWQTKSAADRYHEFVQQNPNLYSQVQLQHIASYLGITPFNLSRIRKQF